MVSPYPPQASVGVSVALPYEAKYLKKQMWTNPGDQG